VGFEKRYVEDVVDIFIGEGESEAKCVGGEFFDNGEGSGASMVELLRWSSCANIFRIEPDLVAYFEGRTGESTIGGRGFVLFLSDEDLFAKVFVELSKVCGHLVSLN